MEKLTGFLLLLAALNFALAQYKVTEKYFKDGGQLTLDLSPRVAFTNIVWKFNGDLVAEWIKNAVTGEVLVPLDYYRNFRGRTTLDLETGRLEIINMTKAEMGVYSVKVNYMDQNERYKAVLIQEVPQPKVAPETCSPASDNCTLTCDADTTDAGPVTYSWKKGDGEWEESGKDLDITGTETDVKTFTCRIKNPVSQRDSQ